MALIASIDQHRPNARLKERQVFRAWFGGYGRVMFTLPYFNAREVGCSASALNQHAIFAEFDMHGPSRSQWPATPLL